MSDSTTNTKTCTTCARTLPATAEYFHVDTKGKFGLQGQCRECNCERIRKHYAANADKKREYAREYRAANADKVREYRSAYNVANADKVRERKREYNEANRDKVREYHREYYAANADKFRENTRKWRAANLERARESVRKWLAENPERRRANEQSRRARKRAAPGTHTAAEIAAQLKRQKCRCYYCDCSIKGGYHVEHVVPLSRGGSNDIGNIVLACKTCNLRKHDKLPHEWVEGGRLL